MEDLTGKIMQIINNKDSLDKIKNLASIFSVSENNNSKHNHKSQDTVSPVDNIPIDTMSKIMKIMPLLSSVNKEDENAKFLKALKPHLKSKRQQKLDEAVKMMQVLKILPILKEQDIFQI